MHVLTFTSLYPNSIEPRRTPFIPARIEATVKRYHHELTVVAPVPWFPRLPFSWPQTYSRFARVPAIETDRGYPVHHPKYLVIPKIGMRWYAKSMSLSARSVVRQIHRDRPIDLIDAHYVFPDADAAREIADDLGIPFVVSARGTDLNLYATLPPIRKRLIATMSAAQSVICVSNGLRQVALSLEIPGEKIRVIGNGVDTSIFHRGPKTEAREKLKLPSDRRIILSVGNMIELKGFHLVLEAISQLEDDSVHYVIAGAGPLEKRLLSLAGEHRMSDRFHLLGSLPPPRLADWYRASDLFALASSREGWPNVLTEAQACGVPILGTNTTGISDIVADPRLGVLVDRTVDALRRGLEAALRTNWDSAFIACVGGSRSWEAVAQEVEEVFQLAAGRSGRQR